ncbi:hypothetical protein IFM89_034212 [Coptis chinensis]|uniref:BED-type domain-containing protein n=1 Tax=Coptis chinensis TaxID=261450 RepID=A0A835H6Q9_9MAGN|nr:hypothetical protein IFM89_034212 [Coptis chinensis]
MIGMANVSASILDTIIDVETPIEDGAEGESVNFYARPPKKQKRKISDVWTQFDKTVEINDDGIVVKNADGSDSMVAICKICFQKLSCGNRGGTSHLRRHKESCLNRTATNTGQTIIGVGPSGSIFSFTFNQDRARRETVRYFVREELPFVKVDKPAFHRWITKSFGPQFKPPSRITMRSDLMMIFEEDKAALKALLDTVLGKISFTSDLWTSNQKLGYMCITAHFITKDWKLHKRVTSFPWLPSPHTGYICTENSEMLVHSTQWTVVRFCPILKSVGCVWRVELWIEVQWMVLEVEREDWKFRASSKLPHNLCKKKCYK